VTLGRDDIDAVAHRVVELLEDETPTAPSAKRLVDAATLARLLGVSRATVYARADELGAIRVGSGKRARLRFDPAALLGARSSDSAGGSAPGPGPRRPRTKSPQRGNRDLLPIRGGRNGKRGPLVS